MQIVKEIVKFIAFPFVFGFGFVYFLLTKKTLSSAYSSFRYLFVLTNGRSNDFHSSLIGIAKKPKKSKSTSGVLGDLDDERINTIVDGIRQNGFYAFDIELDTELQRSLVNFATTTKAKYIDISKQGVNYGSEKILFDAANPISPRYQFDSNDVIQNEAVQSIAFDEGLRMIASNYLGCQPILDLATMWWSAPFGNKGTDQSAQMYHFDMDRFKFLKFFFYLTDVDTNSGPHCYIRNTHKRIPSTIRKDRRISDTELTNFFKAEDIMEFVGKKGTILAVDTRGLHKGKPLVDNARLLFQIQFSNSLFGAPHQKLNIADQTDAIKKSKSQHPRTYQIIN